jgi:hypothetical protein
MNGAHGSLISMNRPAVQHSWRRGVEPDHPTTLINCSDVIASASRSVDREPLVTQIANVRPSYGSEGQRLRNVCSASLRLFASLQLESPWSDVRAHSDSFRSCLHRRDVLSELHNRAPAEGDVVVVLEPETEGQEQPQDSAAVSLTVVFHQLPLDL